MVGFPTFASNMYKVKTMEQPKKPKNKNNWTTDWRALIFCKESNTWVKYRREEEGEGLVRCGDAEVLIDLQNIRTSPGYISLRNAQIKRVRRELEIAYQDCPYCYGESQLHERDYCHSCDELYPTRYNANKHLYAQLRL